MDTVNNEEQDDNPDTGENYLSNCWKLPPRPVYSKFSSSESKTQPSILSGSINSTSSSGGPVL
eukprot:12333933-Ditylum_brightwellii.AAC.1